MSNLAKIKKEIKENNGLTDAEMSMVLDAVEISDPDGAYTHLQDYGIDVDFEDVETLYNYMWR